jgi:hypothetical protein
MHIVNDDFKMQVFSEILRECPSTQLLERWISEVTSQEVALRWPFLSVAEIASVVRLVWTHLQLLEKEEKERAAALPVLRIKVSRNVREIYNSGGHEDGGVSGTSGG